MEKAPKKSDQPPLFPEEEKKPEPVTKIDWDAIKKAVEENQRRLKEEREDSDKEEYWNH